MTKSNISIFPKKGEEASAKIIERTYAGRLSSKLIGTVFCETGWIDEDFMAYGIMVSSDFSKKPIFGVYLACKKIVSGRNVVKADIEKNKIFQNEKELRKYIKELKG